MKISLIISLFPLSVRAFAPSFRNSATFVRSSTAIGSANAEAVAEAMAITKKFGARSKEAAAAWDASKFHWEFCYSDPKGLGVLTSHTYFKCSRGNGCR